MKAVGNKINYFTPVDDKGPVKGTYYLDQFGNVVEFSSRAKPTTIHLPYAVSFNVDNLDDVCTVHISELENVISTFKKGLENVTDPLKRAKYEGYIEALNYIVSHNSYIDPWGDFIDSIEEEFDYDRFRDMDD